MGMRDMETEPDCVVVLWSKESGAIELFFLTDKATWSTKYEEAEQQTYRDAMDIVKRHLFEAKGALGEEDMHVIERYGLPDERSRFARHDLGER